MVYLVEFDAHDGVSLARRYYATEGLTSRPNDSPASQYFTPRIVDPGNFQRTLFGNGTTRGASSVGRGDILFVNGDPGNGETIDDFVRLGVDGRQVVIKRLANTLLPLSAAETIFTGRGRQFTSTDVLNQIALELHDRLSDLNKPLLTSKFAGTTVSAGPTAEGTPDLKNVIKQRLWGSVTNVTGQLVNPFNLLWQFSNGPVISMELFDGALPLSNVGDFVNLASLIAATVPAGFYATCLVLGIARVGVLPVKTLTADVVEGTAAENRTAAQIVRRALTQVFGLTLADVPAASFNALDAKNAAVCGILVTGEQTALSFTSQVLESVGGWLSVNTSDQFVVGRFEAPTGSPVKEFTETEILRDGGGEIERLPAGDEDRGLPVPQVVIRWGRSWTVQGDADVFANVTASRRTLVGSEFREEPSATVSAVTTKYPNQQAITIDTCLAFQADATAEATRKLAMHSVERDRYRISIDADEASGIDLASVVSLTLEDDRMSLGSGKLFSTIGHVAEFAADKVTLDIWG